MDNLINLSGVSEDTKIRILTILAQEAEEKKKNSDYDEDKQLELKQLEQKQLDDFFTKTRSQRLDSVENKELKEKLKGIEIDPDQKDMSSLYEKEFSHGATYKDMRLKGMLTEADAVTYKQLGVIHKDGVVNFWQKVKSVVDGRVDVSKEPVSDQVSIEDIGL